MMKRDRVALCTLLGLGRDGVHVRERGQRFTQRDDACCVDSIVIGNQEEWAVRHALNALSRKHAASKGTAREMDRRKLDRRSSELDAGGVGGIQLREGRRAFALRSANGRGDWI